MKPQDRITFFERLAAERPDPQTELDFVNDYTLLVAVVLSAQATDVGVNKATAKLFETVRDPAAMVALGEEKLRQHIKTIGLYNAKAKNVIALSEILLAKHDGQVPRTRAELEALPGVGRKTANVVLNEAFGQPTLAVDTHVFRVANRTGLAPGKTVDAVEKKLMTVVPNEDSMGAQ
ncbi:MAG: endonuclease III, partial [Pacificimonas sp.]